MTAALTPQTLAAVTGQQWRIAEMVAEMSVILARLGDVANDDVDDQDAKDMQDRLLEIMSREELDELAAQPVAQSISDLTPMQRQTIVMLAQEKKGNPLYNQRQLELEDLTARMGQDFAKRVLLAEARARAEGREPTFAELVGVTSG